MARQFGLAFLPTVVERFDLVVDRHAWFEPPFQRLLAFCATPAFAAKAAELGGYDLAGHGRVVWNAP
jgi:molybdate-binding protein